MSQAMSEESPPPQPPRPAEFAAYLAARMCHDFISPASAVVSGLDLLDDPTAQDMREEAMGLIAGSARKLADLLAFTRVAFGASATAETFDPRVLENLARGVFAHIRAELDWQVAPASVDKATARALLNLAQLAGAALPTGGVAKVRVAEDADGIALSVHAEGPRARLRPEVLAGLRGEGMGEGLHGHWVQAYYLHLILSDVGGRIAAQVDGEKLTFVATVPARRA